MDLSLLIDIGAAFDLDLALLYVIAIFLPPPRLPPIRPFVDHFADLFNKVL